MLAKDLILQKPRRAHAQLLVEYKCALRESGKGKNACDGLPKSENAVKGRVEIFLDRTEWQIQKNTTRP